MLCCKIFPISLLFSHRSPPHPFISLLWKARLSCSGAEQACNRSSNRRRCCLNEKSEARTQGLETRSRKGVPLGPTSDLTGFLHFPPLVSRQSWRALAASAWGLSEVGKEMGKPSTFWQKPSRIGSGQLCRRTSKI